MKMKSILMSMLAIATLVSCNKENDLTAGAPLDASPEKAYLAISVKQSSGQDTRAEATDPDATITTLSIVGFDLAGNKITSKDAADGVYVIPSDKIGGGKTTVTLNGKIKQIFVVANPTSEVSKALAAALQFSALSDAAITAEPIGSLTKANNFLMTSEGLQTVKLAATAGDAEKAPITVKVNRAAVKVIGAVKAPLIVAKDVSASIEKFCINTTNKSYYPYSILRIYAGGTANALYRNDANMKNLTMKFNPGTPATITGDAVDAFNWYHNPQITTSSVPFNNVGTVDYCHENTMEVEAQNYNNTTKVIFLGYYTPAGMTAKTSWFRFNGKAYTFDQLMEEYKAWEIVANGYPNPNDRPEEVKKVMLAFDAFAAKMVTGVPFKSLTLAQCDAAGAGVSGGYLAATATPCMIQFFQKSICYYDVNIMHDTAVPAFGLGRWGVVRNNSYKVQVTGINKPGSPFFPDPTDPEIQDPSNPKPEDPTPNDDSNGNINVVITSQPWTDWNQDVEL